MSTATRRNFIKGAIVAPGVGAAVLLNNAVTGEASVHPVEKGFRGICHVQCGYYGEWEPTKEEMNQVAEMFVKGLADPKGAVIVTRNNVDVCFHEVAYIK